jgi:AraC-like DNA-binding protein
LNWIAIINFLLIAGAIHGFIFNIVTYLFKKKFGPVILFLNLTVLFISLNNLQAWLIDSGYSSGVFFIKYMLIPWYLLVLPMFYSFLIHYLNIEDKFKTFLKQAIMILVFELLLRSALIACVWYFTSGPDTDLIHRYTSYEEIFNALFSLFIFLKAVHLVFGKEEAYRDILNYDDIKWIKLFLILGSAVFMLWMVAIVVFNTTDNQVAYYPLRLATSLLLYWIGYQGLFRYTIIQDRIMLRKSLASKYIEETTARKRQPHASTFINEKHNQTFGIVKNFLVEEQKFLDPLMSLEKLAEELTMSTSHLSKLINGYSGQNFPDFINELRVNQAKKLLSDPEFSRYTIVAIGLECGFNSKSTFYAAFRKFADQTPSEFRERH